MQCLIKFRRQFYRFTLSSYIYDLMEEPKTFLAYSFLVKLISLFEYNIQLGLYLGLMPS